MISDVYIVQLILRLGNLKIFQLITSIVFAVVAVIVVAIVVVGHKRFLQPV